MKTGIIFDIKKFAIHDGPGIRTTVFFKGCPLRCGLCHNPESQAFEPEVLYREGRCTKCGACLTACPNEARTLVDSYPVRDEKKCTKCGACLLACPAEAVEIVGREVTVDEVMKEIEQDIVFYDESSGGATFSGGEPLSQPEFLDALLEACEAQGIHTAVDTSGHANFETVRRIRGKTGLFLYDLKLIDREKHRAFTGVSNEGILENLRELSDQGADVILRVPLIPGVNDDEASLSDIGAFAASLKHRHPVDLLPYHTAGMEKYKRLNRTYLLPEVAPPSKERLAHAAGILRGSGLEVKIRGESNDHE